MFKAHKKNWLVWITRKACRIDPFGTEKSPKITKNRGKSSENFFVTLNIRTEEQKLSDIEFLKNQNPPGPFT